MKILITGSSEGIGLAVAQNLASKDNEITLVSRNKDKLEKALASLKGSGHQIIVADLGFKEEVDKLKKIIETNKYDVLINNAGFGMYGRFTELPLTDQIKMITLNINALTALSYFYLKQAKKGDALVNIASVLGTSSYPSAAVYAATKAYVTNFSEALWWEYKNKGIYVMGFSPGVTFTNFHEVAGGDKNSFPKNIVQMPEQVAIELVDALNKRAKPNIVSGGMNRIMLKFQKLMNRKRVVNMMGSYSTLKGK